MSGGVDGHIDVRIDRLAREAGLSHLEYRMWTWLIRYTLRTRRYKKRAHDRQIAQQLDCNDNSIQNCKKALVRIGLIAPIQPRKDKWNRNLPTLYDTRPSLKLLGVATEPTPTIGDGKKLVNPGVSAKTDESEPTPTIGEVVTKVTTSRESEESAPFFDGCALSPPTTENNGKNGKEASQGEHLATNDQPNGGSDVDMIGGSSDWRSKAVGEDSTQISDGFQYLREQMEKRNPDLKRPGRRMKDIREALTETAQKSTGEAPF